MAGKAKTQAEIFDEIVYAAFSTHYRTVFAAQLKDTNAHEKALEHWNANLPHVHTLWSGLIKGVLVNVQQAQEQGLIPPLVAVANGHTLPGLGGPVNGHAIDTSPASLARRIRDGIKAKQDERRQASPALDVSPGLAIGRCTESPSPDSAPCDPSPSDSGSDGGSDGGGGGGD